MQCGLAKSHLMWRFLHSLHPFRVLGALARLCLGRFESEKTWTWPFGGVPLIPGCLLSLVRSLPGSGTNDMSTKVRPGHLTSNQQVSHVLLTP
ncbi:hypothetical protein BDP55DRAFT_641817 [Colletotrichum godetiae]|uniref:Secreted protein n=1 Tax=Colletotrichum godetiae TaxID=1209918 RepID=A0AAJ0F3C3_9PEZI|nr:uncharacterized protein BDP55DRAFT_641817 [Colletotrichum godetiae]KAK1701521.1 hypothetical protein BDP55DRAFT_641817 [Colletotrichum godetiae]